MKRRAETAQVSARRSKAATILTKLPTDKPIADRINEALTKSEQP